MPRQLRMLIAIVGVAALVAVPGMAGAGGCAASIAPNPGWPGATVTVSGSGFTPGDGFYVNFGGSNIHNGTLNANGAFSFQYTIPGNFSPGQTNYFVSDNAASCEVNLNYTVLASQPTTTTAAPPTTAPPATAPPTTSPPTTSPPTTAPAATVAPTTTLATATTEVTVTTSGSTTTTNATTTSASATSTTGPTTTVGESEGDGGGSSALLLVVVGAVVGAGLVGLGLYFGRRMSQT